LEIGSPLPGILRWFEVVRRRVEEIPPVKFACETMERTTGELRQLISHHTADPKRNINPLSMRLQVSHVVSECLCTFDASHMGKIFHMEHFATKS
jgi:hypothetical protein